MSSLYLNVYIQSDAATQAAIRQFVTLVNAQDYLAVAAIDIEDKLYDIEEILASAIALQEGKEFFQLTFASATSLEVEVLVHFFHSLGAVTVEISVFDSRTGETFYVDNAGAYHDDHAYSSWQLLPSPSAGFVGLNVVVTGTFANYTRSELEGLISQHGGKIQKSINGNTSLLVIGAKPGADKTGKAELLNVRIMREEELLDTIAGGNLNPAAGLAIEATEKEDTQIVTYQYCFPAQDDTARTLPIEQREELISLFRESGYLNEYFYKTQLKSLRDRRPAAAVKFSRYRHATDIPMEERGTLEPRSAWDIANIFSQHNTLITSHAPYIFQADKKGYGHALTQIAQYSGMPLKAIEYTSNPGAPGNFTLSCEFDGKNYRTSFKSSKDTFPKAFLRLLHDIAAQSPSWDFVVHVRPDQKSYAVIPSALARGLARHGFLKPLFKPAL
jgi:hypothetical protein